MIITGITIGAVSFGIQYFNSWRNEKNAKAIQARQEAFQRAAMEQSLEIAMEQFKTMSDARRMIMAEEHNERISLMHELHKHNLKTIAELTSLDKWPLAVMPLVMRDDNLFGNENDDDSIIPINVIMGPCRDHNFQTKIWKSVEDELSIRFSKSWNKGSNHPILFYQDAWKDDKDPADSAQCANIHASTQNVPTIIFSPVFTKKGLQIEMTHWCITGMDVNKSYCREIRLSIDKISYLYKQNDSYNDIDTEFLISELVDVLESIIGFMDDQYMWCRYSVVPILPQLLSMRYDIEDETINALYSQYVAMLQSSMSNSQIQVVMDLDSVLSYCAVLDQFGKSDKAFMLVCKSFLGDKTLVDPKSGLPAYEIEKLITFLRYIKRHQGELTITEEFINGLCYSISLESLYRKCIENLYTDGRIFSYDEANKFIMNKPFIGIKQENLATECLNICDILIERCCQETDSNTDRRNWVRPKFREQIFEAFDQKASECIIEIDKKSQRYKKEVLTDILKETFEHQQKDELLHLGNEADKAIERCYYRLKEFLKSKESYVSKDFWKSIYIKESVDVRILEYCNTSLTKWIDYVWLKEDIIHDSISDDSKNLIASKMDNVNQMLEKIADEYIIMNYPPQI